MKNKRGSSILEIIFSVGMTVLVITGIVSLMVNSINIKTKAFNRGKASEMTLVIVENLLKEKKDNSVNFWLLNDLTNMTLATGFDGFTYNVDFTRVIDDECSDSGEADCARANITVFWNDGEESLSVERFFSK